MGGGKATGQTSRLALDSAGHLACESGTNSVKGNGQGKEVLARNSSEVVAQVYETRKTSCRQWNPRLVNADVGLRLRCGLVLAQALTTSSTGASIYLSGSMQMRIGRKHSRAVGMGSDGEVVVPRRPAVLLAG